MPAQADEYSMHIYEMMARLGIDPSAGVLPRFSFAVCNGSSAV